MSAVLAGANAYLGMFAGLTVVRVDSRRGDLDGRAAAFQKSNILEHNIVQTGASAGESLAAGVIFTFPALVLLGYWSRSTMFG